MKKTLYSQRNFFFNAEEAFGKVNHNQLIVGFLETGFFLSSPQSLPITSIKSQLIEKVKKLNKTFNDRADSFS